MLPKLRLPTALAVLSLSSLAACHTVGPYQSGSPQHLVVAERDVESGGYALVELVPRPAGGTNLQLAEQPRCKKEQTLYDETRYTTKHVFERAYVSTPMIIVGGASIMTGALLRNVTSAKNLALLAGGTVFLSVGLAIPGHDATSSEYTTQQSERYTRLGEDTYDCGSTRPFQGRAELSVQVSSTREGEQGFDFRMPYTEPAVFPPEQVWRSLLYWAKTCELNGYRTTFNSKQMREGSTWTITLGSLPSKVARAGKLEAALKLGDRCLEQRRSRNMTQCWEAAYSKNVTACERSCLQAKGGDLCAFEKTDCTSLGGNASDCAATYESCLAKRGLGPEVRKQCIDKCVADEIGTRCEDQWKTTSPVALPN